MVSTLGESVPDVAALFAFHHPVLTETSPNPSNPAVDLGAIRSGRRVGKLLIG